MSNMYDIIDKLKNVMGLDSKPVEKPVETVYETVEARGSITEAVKSLESKYATFKEAKKAKPDFLDVDKDGDKKEPFKKAVKDKEAVNEVFSDEEAKAQRDATKDRAWKAKGEANTKKYEKNKKAAEKRAQERAAKKAKQVSEGADDLTDLDAYQFADPDKDVSVSPAQAKKDAAEKRRRLQDIEDRKAEKDDWFSGNNKEPNVRIHRAKYQDEPEELEEYSQAEYDQAMSDFKSKGGRTQKLPAGSAKNPISTASRHIGGRGEVTKKGKGTRVGRDANTIPSKPVVDVAEVAPPGAKAERMVKHIKKGYAKDGKLSKKEKGIAYATAWKAHNKGQVEEGTEFKDAGKIKNSAPNMKKAKLAKVTEGRVMEETDYFYEKIGKALAEQNPHLDTASSEFNTAVYKEMIAQGIPPNRARNIMMIDDDFMSDVATSYGHCCKEVNEASGCTMSEAPMEQELDEIARLAGLPKKQEIDENPALAAALPAIGLVKMAKDDGFGLEEVTAPPRAVPSDKKSTFDPSTLKAPGAKPARPFADTSRLNAPADSVSEEEIDEGNEFTKARLDAIAAGKDTFTVGGKTYKVAGDTSQEKSMGESSSLNDIRRLSGLAEEEELAEERDIEWDNTPEEDVAPISASIPSGTDLHKSKKQDPKTANKAANPLKIKEDALWKSYENMINDIKE